MAGASSLNTSSTVTEGPVRFGAVSSGTGTVVFGTSSPAATAAVANLTSNPWLLALAAAAVLGGVYLYLKARR